MNLFLIQRAAWIVVAAALGAVASQAQPPANTCNSVSIQELKSSYLACDRLMSSRRLDATVVQRCAAIGAQVQQRGFGGDFDALIAWWQGERGAARPSDASVALPVCAAVEPAATAGAAGATRSP